MVCGKPECLSWRHRQAQRRWRQRHPEDGVARRLRAALAKAKQPEVKLELPRPPPVGIPWEELRDEISPQQLVIASFFVKLVFRSGRDAIVSEVSRIAVLRVLQQGTAEVPPLEHVEQLSAELGRIRELYVSCQGNLVRVHEELSAAGIKTAYTTLTAFCRRHEIGTVPKQVVGRYEFLPGQEMQHDTSPHRPIIAGTPRLVQCASLVLCYSRMLFAQTYPKFNRFWCKVFLVEAIRYFEGAACRCMLDNSSIIIVHGTGADAVAAPEMAALAEDFGFQFVAHALGDANRSARVERNFDYIERNFYAGRSFADVADCNRQMRGWCDQVNQNYKRSLHSAPRDLFAVEKPALRRLPMHIHEPTEVAHRTVDVMGFVTVHTNSYSVPLSLLDHDIDVMATTASESSKAIILSASMLVSKMAPVSANCCPSTSESANISVPSEIRPAAMKRNWSPSPQNLPN